MSLDIIELVNMSTQKVNTKEDQTNSDDIHSERKLHKHKPSEMQCFPLTKNLFSAAFE